MSVKGVEDVERNKKNSLPFLLLFYESWILVKKNPDRKLFSFYLRKMYSKNEIVPFLRENNRKTLWKSFEYYIHLRWIAVFTDYWNRYNRPSLPRILLKNYLMSFIILVFLVTPLRTDIRLEEYLEPCQKSLTYSAPTPQNGETHSNNSSAVADELFECVWPFCVVGT